MTVRRHGFDEMTTEVQPDPLGGEPVAVRIRPEIAWTDGQGAHAFAVEERAAIGTAPGNDVVLQDPTVSRLHAELGLVDQAVWVRDLGSRNGTFVSGVQVKEAKVPDGGRVRLGGTELVVSYGATPSRVELWKSDAFGPLLGHSAAMRACFARLARIAGDDSTVLIQGETGTGKELVARAIHEASPRAAQPFVVVDCGALPDNLLEAELFGHARGAFTGAAHSRAGAFECAEGGTVFLDEVGELPLAMQPKLLRVLESRTVRRLGESEHRRVDVRVLSATHRELGAMVNAGAFREDLYFRVAVLLVTVPPLRARLEDIPVLVKSFLPAGAPPLGAELLVELARRPWLGNVRELRNFVARARVLGAEDALALDGAASRPGSPADALPPVDTRQPFREVRARWLDHLEREYVRRLLAEQGGNVSSVAKTAGLDRTYVHRLIRKHDL